MKYSSPQGFSLIEVLLVIGIFGILAFIILAANTTLRARAERNKSLQFSRSIHNWLVEEGVGVWAFDEGTGTTTIDTSTTSQTLPIGNATWTQGVLKNGLSFNGTTASINITQPLFQTTPRKLSVSFWIKPVTSSGTQVLLYNANRSEFLVALNNNKEPYVDYRLSNGTWHTLNSAQPLSTEVWSHIAFRFNADNNEVSLFINGVQRATAQPGSGAQLYNGSGPGTIGSRSGFELYNGAIDELELYQEVF